MKKEESPSSIQRFKHLEGNGPAYRYGLLKPLSPSPLQGQRVLFLGSSVTNGYASGNQGIPELFAARFGCLADKRAVDGTTLADTGPSSYVERLYEVDEKEKLSLFVCQLSTNDAQQHQPLGGIASPSETPDPSTITGAVQTIVRHVRHTFHCPVVFYTNCRFPSGAFPKEVDEGYARMVSQLEALSAQEGFSVLDLWTSDKFNDLTEERRRLYMADAIHPTMAGYRDWWLPEIEKQLTCLYSATEM